jgi:hypothetical protein
VQAPEHHRHEGERRRRRQDRTNGLRDQQGRKQGNLDAVVVVGCPLKPNVLIGATMMQFCWTYTHVCY